MPDSFTHDGYRELLQAFLDRGYQGRGYADAEPAAPHFILRHDLDMSLQAAEPIAAIEASLGLKATYFVLLRTEIYNVFSPAAQVSVRAIRKAGHDIGLHLDASLYGNDIEALEAAAEHECAVLEAIIAAPIGWISFHRPAKALLGYDGQIAGRGHAYAPRFFHGMGYCSDSRGDWHHGHPLEHEAVKDGRALQLLTHPIWWPAEARSGPVAKLDEFVAARRGVLESELAENCEPYRAKHRNG